MKKLLIIALAIIPVLFACKKGSTTPTTPDLKTPTYAKQAAKVELSTPITLKTTKGKAVSIKKIDFLRGGSYIAEAIIAKADEQTTTLTGTWTYTDGKGYDIKGEIVATVAVDKSGAKTTVTVTTSAEGAQSSEATVEETKVQEGSTEDKIYRDWTIAKIVLADFEKLGSASVVATSLTSMVSEIEKKGVNISADAKQKLLDHEVTKISLDEGVMLVIFKNEESFKGEFPKLSSTSTSADFNVDLSSFVKDLNDKVKGTVSFNAYGQAVLALQVPNIKDFGAGKAEITLSPKQ